MDDADEEEGEEGEGGEGEEVDVVEALRPGGAQRKMSRLPAVRRRERASSLGDGVSIEGGTPNTAPPTPAKATPRSRVACRSSDGGGLVCGKGGPYVDSVGSVVVGESGIRCERAEYACGRAPVRAVHLAAMLQKRRLRPWLQALDLLTSY